MHNNQNRNLRHRSEASSKPLFPNAKNINLYFVVPPDIFEKFPLQKYKTAKDEECQRIPGWINKITQYALEINLGINNKGAKKRSSDAISEDDKNEEASEKRMVNKDVEKRKTKRVM